MKKIENRADIQLLVRHFYNSVREDELLGSIFKNHIADEKWEEHLATLTDFWETNLFGVANFKGNPSAKHIAVDKNLNYSISPIHFGRWLQLWFEAIDELYTGDLATKAKNAARKMSTGQFLAIWKSRPVS